MKYTLNFIIDIYVINKSFKTTFKLQFLTLNTFELSFFNTIILYIDLLILIIIIIIISDYNKSIQ